MSKLRKTLLFSVILCPFLSFAQVSYTANDIVPPYNGTFGYGTNMGYYGPHYFDEQLATLVRGTPDGTVPGLGVTTIRPALPENFLEQWGYDIRTTAFQLYDSLGLKDNVVFVGFPSESARDNTPYCVEGPSESFKGLYEPIWDDGQNGTPVNDANLYALYIWNTVKTYKKSVKYWEIMNEPDLDNKGNAWKPADMPGNWWTNNPQPCEYKFRAPIFHYIRMLRISYEVIKTADPTAYVCIGGVGYPSFMDAVCRNTDNPNNGQVSSEFPLKGGAYFDVVSFHSYPHLDNSMRVWDIPRNQFRYFRHSDAAMRGVWQLRDQFKFVMDKFGYDGSVFPSKHWIITEVNIPRKQFGDYVGSDAAQTNFMMKTLITAQIENVDQVHVYNLADDKKTKDADSEFHFMGLYENLVDIKPFEGQLNDMAIGYKTTAETLGGKRYDADQTSKLNLPAGVQGAAFIDKQGFFTYALWAETTEDRSEVVFAEYAFPDNLNIPYLIRKGWRYGDTKQYNLVNAKQVELDGSPAFFSATNISPNEYPKDARIFPNPTDSSGGAILSFWAFDETLYSIRVFDTSGKLVQTLANQRKFVQGAHQIPLDWSNLAKGMYFIQLESASEKVVVKGVRG